MIRSSISIASANDVRVTLQGCIDMLECWNLKHESFPSTLCIGKTLLLECGKLWTHEFEFSSEYLAAAADVQLHEAMVKRANAYWGVS